MNNFRLLQLVVFACTCLLLLKSAALVFTGGTVLTGAAVVNAQEAKEATDAKKAEDAKDDAKGTADKADPKAEQDKKSADAGAAKKNDEMAGPMKPDAAKQAEIDASKMKPEDTKDNNIQSSASELDLLESLALRRKQLNDREAQLVLKENLLKAAEGQIDERIKQLKALEAKIQVSLKKQDVMQQGQYKRLVKIYSSMKPKEAARIFDGLQMPILVDLVSAMKAASGSQIIAKMDSDKARQLTLLLAQKDQVVASKVPPSNDVLPGVEEDRPAEQNQ